MSGSWNDHDRLKARIAACKGTYSPTKYAVRIDDDHARWRYRIASAALFGEGISIPGFLVWCAEYVILYHKDLKNVRRAIRQAERQMVRDKKKRERDDARWRREMQKRVASREKEMAAELARGEGNH